METKNSQDLIKDLVHITNDRISGFEKVEGVVWEGYPDVKSEYDKLISKSKVMKNELVNILLENDVKFDDSGTLGGALHGTWIDIKNSFMTGSAVNSTLENVIFGEKSAIETYRNALEKGDFSEETEKVLKDHLHDLETYHHQFEKMLEYRK